MIESPVKEEYLNKCRKTSYPTALTYEEILWLIYANKEVGYSSPYINSEEAELDYKSCYRVRGQIREKLIALQTEVEEIK
jgi:hypothetical protein